MNPKSKFLLHVSGFVFLAVCLNFTSAEVSCNNLNQYVLIRNVRSGLVIDGSNQTKMTVELYNQSDFQQWQMHPASRPGLFNFINKGTGKAIDVNLDYYVYYLVQNSVSDSVYQQWFINSNGTIANAGLHNDYVIDISDNDLLPGNDVQAYPFKWNGIHYNQIFSIDFISF